MRNVTEDMALAILERYPTLYSLVLAYTELVSVHMVKQSVLRTVTSKSSFVSCLDF